MSYIFKGQTSRVSDSSLLQLHIVVLLYCVRHVQAISRLVEYNQFSGEKTAGL